MHTFLITIFAFIMLLIFYRMPLLSPNQQQLGNCRYYFCRTSYHFRNCIDIKHVLQYYVNLVEFLISLSHVPPHIGSGVAWVIGAQGGLAAPKSREMPGAPLSLNFCRYHPHFFVISLIICCSRAVIGIFTCTCIILMRLFTCTLADAFCHSA